MKAHRTFFVALFILPLLFVFASASAQTHFSVKVEQSGIICPVDSGVVHLKKALFSFLITLPKPTAILVAASLDPNRYELAREGAPMDEFIKPGTGGAEHYFNQNRSIFVGKLLTNYWYYKSDSDHRFDEVKHIDSGLLCRRTIASVYCDDARLLVPIRDLKAPQLYLVFIHEERAESGDYQEKQRETMLIKFDR